MPPRAYQPAAAAVAAALVAACDRLPVDAPVPLVRPPLNFAIIPAPAPAGEAPAPVPLAAADRPAAVPTAPDAQADAAGPPATAPAAPQPAVVAPPPAGGSGGGGNNGASPMVGGVVYGTFGATEAPLAGATVRTTDGRTARTDALGRFQLPLPPPADGFYLASAPGHAASAVVAFAGTGNLDMHLKSLAALAPGPAAPATLIGATGTVVDDQGAPLPGILVMIGDDRGASSNPAATGPDGRFTLLVEAPGGVVPSGTLLAVDTRGRRVGMATGLALAGAMTTLDVDPATPAVDPLRMLTGTHELRLTIDRTAFPAPAPASIDMVAPDGTSLGLYDTAGRVMVAPVPGARYDLRVAGVDAATEARSEIYRKGLAIDFLADHTDLRDALLAPPAFTMAPTLVDGSALTWSAVAGARGYSLALASVADGAFRWEAFTASEGLPFLYPGGTPPAGTYAATLTAWDAEGLTARSLAAVGPARLRLIEPAGGYRKSSRITRVVLP